MLKYLREIGPDHGVTLYMENSYGLTPVVYAAMNHEVYAFIYLFHKLKSEFLAERAAWVVTQLIKQGSEDTEILQLLLHEKDLRGPVAESALNASVEHCNPVYLKAILRHLYHSQW